MLRYCISRCMSISGTQNSWKLHSGQDFIVLPLSAIQLVLWDCSEKQMLQSDRKEKPWSMVHGCHFHCAQLEGPEHPKCYPVSASTWFSQGHRMGQVGGSPMGSFNPACLPWTAMLGTGPSTPDVSSLRKNRGGGQPLICWPHFSMYSRRSFAFLAKRAHC